MAAAAAAADDMAMVHLAREEAALLGKAAPAASETKPA